MRVETEGRRINAQYLEHVPPLNTCPRVPKAKQLATEQRAMQALVMAAARPAVPPPPALTQGEIHVLEDLYSTGVDAPPIRVEALTFGLGLDVANHLEEDNITTSSKLTETTIRKYQTRLQVLFRFIIILALGLGWVVLSNAGSKLADAKYVWC